MVKYKRCDCSEDYWEKIIVDKDENFGDKTVIYFHCDFCGEDNAIVSFDTGEILYLKQTEEDNCKM